MKNQIELKIEYKKVDDLLPYARNARTHSEEQITQLASSIKEFGFNNPVAIDSDNMILCGHGRVMAAKKLGLDKIPTVNLSHLTPTQKKAYILADNKLALNAGWDEEMLKLELEELKLANFDLDLVGFDSLELEDIFDEGEEASILDGQYTTKVQTPQYEITGEKPDLKECFDDSKTNKLLSDIDASKVPEDIKNFLRLAAYRHTIFNYTNIAEYYAHASPEVQKLFEDSALVIIDFNDAVKNGYIKLKEEIADMLQQEKEKEEND